MQPTLPNLLYAHLRNSCRFSLARCRGRPQDRGMHITRTHRTRTKLGRDVLAEVLTAARSIRVADIDNVTMQRSSERNVPASLLTQLTENDRSIELHEMNDGITWVIIIGNTARVQRFEINTYGSYIYALDRVKGEQS